MQTVDQVRDALNLLTSRDRRRLVLVTVAQASLSVLDLIGVALIGVVAAASTAVVQGSSVPFVGPWLDSFTTGDSVTLVLLVTAVIAGLLLIGKSALSMLLTRRIFGFLAKRQAWVSGRLAQRLVELPMAQLLRRSSQGTAYALMAGVNAAVLGVLGSGVVLVSESTLLVVLGILLMWVDPVVGLFTIIFFVAVALMVHRFLATEAMILGATTARAEVASLGAIQELIHTYRELTVTGRRRDYAGRFEGLRGTASAAQAGTQFINLLPKYIFEIALVIGAAVLAASQLLTKDAPAAVAVIAVYLAAASRMLPSMLRLQSSLIMVRGSAAVARSMYELVGEVRWAPDDDRPPVEIHVEPNQPAHSDHEGFVGTLEARDVSLWHDGAVAPTLRGVSIVVPEGTSLAIVGSTGAGKSTLVDLLMGMASAAEGSVIVSGLSPQDAIERWPGAIGCVPQDVAIVEGTVRTNVALGLSESEIDDDLVWAALSQSHLADFLTNQREGLETMVGEQGLRLSGGQRQRLGLARALYSRPKLLFLDEATSALDAETEKVISDAIVALSGRMTVVVVAHRLSTIRNMDQVLYLENGYARATGSFDEVRSLVPEFDAQAKLMGL